MASSSPLPSYPEPSVNCEVYGNDIRYLMAEASPYIKHYLMTAGPTPLPPRVSPGDGRADPLPPRARLRGALRARLEASSRSSGPRTTCSASPPRAPGAWSPPSPTSRPGEPAARRLLRQVRRALGGAQRGLRRRAPPSSVEWGDRVEPASSTRVLGEHRPAHEGRLHDPVGDLDRRRQRHPGAHRGRPRARRADRRRRRLRPRRGPIPQDEWGVDVIVGGLAEGAHVPARPRLRARSRSARSTSPPRSQRAPTTSTGRRRQGPAQGSAGQPVHPGGLALHGARRRPRHDRGGGPRERLRAPRQLGAAARAGVEALGLELFGPDDQRRQRRHRLQDPRGRRRRQAAEAAARQLRHHRAGGQGQLKGKISGSPTPATSAPSTSSPRSTALEMALRDLGAEVEPGAGVAAAQRVFQEAGVPAGATA